MDSRNKGRRFAFDCLSRSVVSVENHSSKCLVWSLLVLRFRLFSLLVSYNFQLTLTMSLKLYVGNLNYNTTEESLRSAFEPYGNVVSVKIIQGKGFGFVEYGSTESAEAAKAGMDGKDLDGRPLRVNDARPPEKKPFGERGERGGFNRGGERGGFSRGGDRGGFNKRY